MAAEFGQSDAIVALLEAGAEIASRNENELTPLHLAALWDKSASITTLLDNGAGARLKALGCTPLELISESSPFYKSNV